MDNTTSGALGLVALVISVGSTLLVAINHKRIRSKCCGRSIEASFDIENTSPNAPKPIVPEITLRTIPEETV